MAKKNNKQTKLSKSISKKDEATHFEVKWNVFPLRIALGLMFLVAGLIKLISLLGGSNTIPEFFASLGIPFSVFSAWLVAFVEVIGGLFLIIGLLTWATGFCLGIIMLIATIFTSINPWNWSSLTQHLTYITAIIAVMYGNKYFSLSKNCGCKYCKK